MAALLRYYSHFRLDPLHMDADDFARAIADLSYSLKKVGHMSKNE